MKKITFIIIIIFIIVSCSKNSTNQSNSIPQSNISNESSQKYDFDFTGMSYNVLSGVLFDILIAPEKYVDKTIKVAGQFNTQIHEGKRYFSVIKWDSTGCCPAGIDFIPPENMKFPEDFPENNAEITVCGQMVMMGQGDEESLYLVADKVLLSD